MTRDASGGPMVVMACRRCDAESLRERSAQLESDNRFLREREAHFARVLGVCDGGKYRADWNSAIERVVEERSAALARVKELESELEEMRDLALDAAVEANQLDEIGDE